MDLITQWRAARRVSTPLVRRTHALAAFPAEQATAMSLRKDGLDIAALWERKRRMIEQAPGLSVWRGDESFQGGTDTMTKTIDFAKRPGGIYQWIPRPNDDGQHALAYLAGQITISDRLMRAKHALEQLDPADAAADAEHYERACGLSRHIIDTELADLVQQSEWYWALTTAPDEVPPCGAV